MLYLLVLHTQYTEFIGAKEKTNWQRLCATAAVTREKKSKKITNIKQHKVRKWLCHVTCGGVSAVKTGTAWVEPATDMHTDISFILIMITLQYIQINSRTHTRACCVCVYFLLFHFFPRCCIRAVCWCKRRCTCACLRVNVCDYREYSLIWKKKKIEQSSGIHKNIYINWLIIIISNAINGVVPVCTLFYKR